MPKMNYYLLNNSFNRIKDVYCKKGSKYTQGNVINIMDHYMM